MRVQAQYTSYNCYNRKLAYQNIPVNFASYKYAPGAKHSIKTLNPAILYMNKIFERSLIISRKRIQSIMPELKPYTEEIPLGKSYALDINKDNRKKYLVVLHGAGQNVSNLQPLYKEVLDKTEFGILAPEYRGFGKNKPDIISTDSFLEDTQQALDYLTEKKEINPQNICIMGHSLGGFIAARLVHKNDNLGHLILVCPIDSLSQNSVNIGSNKNMPKLVIYLLKHFNFIRNSINKIVQTNNYIKKINTPIDIIHSKDDRTINYSSSQNIAANCKKLNSFHMPESGGHGIDSSKIDIITSLLK